MANRYSGFQGSVYDYHGGPYDRGMADSYYRRPRDPHKYPNGKYNGPKVTNLTEEELEAYNGGYDDNEKNRNYKDYGDDS